jgi:hypothetical protein
MEYDLGIGRRDELRNGIVVSNVTDIVRTARKSLDLLEQASSWWLKRNSRDLCAKAFQQQEEPATLEAGVARKKNSTAAPEAVVLAQIFHAAS